MWKALFLSLLLSATALAASAKPGPELEWVVQQVGTEWGPQTIHASSRGVKIENHKYEAEVLTQPPDWKVYIFRNKDKLLWSGAKLDMSKVINVAGFGKAPAVGTCTKEGRQDYLGLACNRYIESHQSSYSLGTALIKLDPRAVQFLCDSYCIPRMPEFPLANFRLESKPKTTLYAKGDWLHEDYWKGAASTIRVKTISFKKAPLDPRNYAIPIGYKIVKEPSEILMSRSKSELIDMIQGVGFAASDNELKGGQPAKGSADRHR